MEIFSLFFWWLCWATDEMKAQQTLVIPKREKSSGSSSSENKINRNGLIESKRIDKRRSEMFSELTTKSHLHDTTVGNLFTLRPPLPFVVVSLSLLSRYFQDHLAPNATQIEINIKAHSANSLVMFCDAFFHQSFSIFWCVVVVFFFAAVTDWVLLSHVRWAFT